MYLDGFRYWFSSKEEERMKQQNEYFRIVSDEEQLILERFRSPRPTDIKTYSAATIAQRIFYGRIPISSRKVSLIMKKLGYRSERNKRGCFYRLYELKPDEQQTELAKGLSVETPENQSVATEQDLPF